MGDDDIEQLTISDEITDARTKNMIEKYSDSVENEIKSYIIKYISSLKMDEYPHHSTEIPMCIDEDDICASDINLIFGVLYPSVFEMLLLKMTKEKLIQKVESYKIIVKIEEFLHKKRYEDYKFYQSGYTQKHERKKISQIVTIASARKLMSNNYIPKFEYCIGINKSYHIKTEHNSRDIKNVIIDFIHNMIPCVESLDGSNPYPEEISYERFTDYYIDNEFVKLLKYFEIELDKDDFLDIKQKIRDLLIEKTNKMKISNDVFNVESSRNNIYIDVVGTNIRGDIIYIIEGTNSRITERWDELRKIFPFPHYKFIQASSKPIKKLPNFVENWVFNEKTEKMDVVSV